MSCASVEVRSSPEVSLTDYLSSYRSILCLETEIFYR